MLPQPNPLSEIQSPDSSLDANSERTQIVNSESLRRSSVRPRRFVARSSLDVAIASPNRVLLALSVAKQQINDARREIDRLMATNEWLASALADAARRGTEAQRIAHHDELTGLPNRLALMERLRAAIENAHRQRTQLALLFIDLDGFKVVNDRYGHSSGDKLLAAAAKRIATCIRAEDIACRYGGDEFVVVLSDIHDLAIATGIAKTIRSHIGRRYSIEGRKYRVTASIGLAMYPDDSESAEALLNLADASMYRGKSARSSNLSRAL